MSQQSKMIFQPSSKVSWDHLERKVNNYQRTKSKINILNNLLKDVVLLKPDKGNGVVPVDCLNYKNSVKQMLPDRIKFRKIL